MSISLNAFAAAAQDINQAKADTTSDACAEHQDSDSEAGAETSVLLHANLETGALPPVTSLADANSV